VDGLHLGDGRVVRREVDPVHHREHPEVVLLLVDDVGVAARQEPECPPGANDVNRLPQAVKDKHGLIEGCLHTGHRDSDCGPRLSSGCPGRRQENIDAPNLRYPKGRIVQN
jgi:hypothetical protein